MESTNNQVQEFVKKSFQENQDYSFGDWAIMYEHSLKVKEIALQIAKSVNCDKELLGIEALLHDIGKTYKTDTEVLREHHAELGYEVAKNFLPKLNLSREQNKKIARFLSGNMDSIEARMIKDADIIAFFFDERLQEAFKIWADEQGFSKELQKKADKINKLEFEVSKIIAKPLYEEMKERWHLK
jgi:putative nucleotidyltransferase with HDIG domain